MNGVLKTPWYRQGGLPVCMMRSVKPPPVSQTAEERGCLLARNQYFGVRRSFHMNSMHNELEAHLKKYYGVDVQVASDGRIEFPWTQRNSNDILKQLYERFQSLPAGSLAIEFASGSGEHIAKLAQKIPQVTFYPTDGDAMLLPSMKAWAKHFNVSNVAEPSVLDFSCQVFSKQVDAAWVVNTTHISPWSHTVGLFTNLVKVLKPGSWFAIYGAFNRDGKFTSESNKDFDRNLRQRNSEWGIRDVETVRDEAQKHGLILQSIHEMPANNFMVWFRLVFASNNMLQSMVAASRPSVQRLLRVPPTRAYRRHALLDPQHRHPFRVPTVPRSPLPLHHPCSTAVRPITFSAAPRLIFSIGRLPLILAGGTAASVGLANSKIQDWNDTAAGFLLGVKELMDTVQTEVINFDLKVPELHITMPEFVKDILRPKDGFSRLYTFGQLKHEDEVEIASRQQQNNSNSGGNGGGSGLPPSGAALAAAAAFSVSDDEEYQNKRSRPNRDTIIQHDEQFMMLTKKLIEIRSILLSIDHNETLKLPSIVVIGSQSSGKSSVLEAIVGHEFLPKGFNMVTRRPIELTLVHTPNSEEEYGEFPQLELGKVHDFKQIQKTLTDLNMAVSDAECVSAKPIELRIYSASIPDLTLIDLPGYIQISNRNQPETLKLKIEELCDKYIREPNIILAVCAADVDLANSTALRASRRVDPMGLRTIGVITKMDLVPASTGAAILRNSEYPLHLGYIGVVCKAPDDVDGNMTSALIRNEENFFRNRFEFNQRGVNVGTATLRRKLMNVLEQSMGRSLYSIVDAVQKELEEARYQFKVQYNDRRVTSESYVAETMDSLKHNFKEFATLFGKPQVRHEVRTMLEQRVLDICAETYWSDPKVSDLPKATPDDIYWLYKVDLASAALTKSGIGRATTQLVVDILMNNMERLSAGEPFNYHAETRKQIASFTSEILRTKFLTTSDQVENTIKPYKYEVEVTDLEWQDGVKRSVALLEKELEMCDNMANNIKNAVGKTKLRGAIKFLLDTEREDQRRQERVRQQQDGTSEPYIEYANLSDEEEAIKPLYNPKLLEKAREALFLRDRAMILKYRIAALKSRQCKTQDNKQYCPEAFLNVIAEKLTYTAVMFIQVELLNEFFFQFPREVDNRLVYDLDRQQIQRFARENPSIMKHLDLQERKSKLEDVMDKLNYLVRKQADRQARAKMNTFGGV